MVSWKDTPSKRERCIAMTDTINPNLNCQWEIMTNEEFGAGKYALVKIDKKVYRCLTPTTPSAASAAPPASGRFAQNHNPLSRFKQDANANEEQCPNQD